MKTIIGISGSLRSASYNSALLRQAAYTMDTNEQLHRKMTLVIINIESYPLFNADVEAAGVPTIITEHRKAIAEASGVLIATPEYNHTLSGALKNALDWHSRGPEWPFREKPTAIMGASTGRFGTVRAQAHLRVILTAIGANVLPRPELMVAAAASQFSPNGTLTDAKANALLETLLITFNSFIVG